MPRKPARTPNELVAGDLDNPPAVTTGLAEVFAPIAMPSKKPRADKGGTRKTPEELLRNKIEDLGEQQAKLTEQTEKLQTKLAGIEASLSAVTAERLRYQRMLNAGQGEP